MKQDSAPDPFNWIDSIIDGKYRVDAVVGEGGFGVVYVGHHLGFDEPVAIKCLKLDDAVPAAKRELFLKGFIAEGRILYRLSKTSPHIVRAIDVGAATSPTGTWTPYLVLEWIEGRTLSVVIEERSRSGLGGRSIEDAYELLEPVARALDAAHAGGIAHRDVKPANLLVVELNGQRTVKVVDFGVAKVMSQAGDIGGATAPGTLLRAFSPSHGAPEQFDSKFGSTGPWTDVFALALVLVETVLGRRALDGDNATQFYIRSTDPTRRPTLRTLGLDTSDAVERVLERAVAVDPRSRFQRAGPFWDALGDAMGGSRARKATRARVVTTVDATADATACVRTEVPTHPITIPGVPPPTMTDVPMATLSVLVHGRSAAVNAPLSATPIRGSGPTKRIFVLWSLGLTTFLAGAAGAIWLARTDLGSLNEELPQRIPGGNAPPTPRTSTTASRSPANDGTDARRPVLPDADLTLVDPHGFHWGDRCWASLKSGRWGWAKAECDKGMAANPASPQPRASLLYNEGLIALAAGDVNEARGDFITSLVLRDNENVRVALDGVGVEPGAGPAPIVDSHLTDNVSTPAGPLSVVRIPPMSAIVKLGIETIYPPVCPRGGPNCGAIKAIRDEDALGSVRLVSRVQVPGANEAFVLMQELTAGNACSGATLWFVRVRTDGSYLFSQSIPYCGGPSPIVVADARSVHVVVPAHPPNRGDGTLTGFDYEYDISTGALHKVR